MIEKPNEVNLIRKRKEIPRLEVEGSEHFESLMLKKVGGYTGLVSKYQKLLNILQQGKLKEGRNNVRITSKDRLSIFSGGPTGITFVSQEHLMGFFKHFLPGVEISISVSNLIINIDNVGSLESFIEEKLESMKNKMQEKLSQRPGFRAAVKSKAEIEAQSDAGLAELPNEKRSFNHKDVRKDDSLPPDIPIKYDPSWD